MKKTLLTTLAFLSTLYGISQPANLAGIWLGTLDVGVKIRLVFHIHQTAPNVYTATMDSPDQGAKGIPVSSVIVKPDSVLINVEVIKGSFKGSLLNDTTITGSWSQGAFKTGLNLIKTAEIVALKRPQTPKPPFAYTSEEVAYSNADNTVRFGGTFTYPSTGGTFPTAILITGSGQQDRDETIFEHKPFAVIADYLTKKGFAILRVDDRGVGKTTGDVMKATSEDFAKDVEAGLAYLLSRRETDKSRLGLIGHSEGGLIAALVAAKRKDINFMISLAGPGVKGSDLLAGQVTAVLTSQGISSDAVNSYKDFYSRLLNISAAEKDTATAYQKSWTAYQSWKERVPPTQRNLFGYTNDSTSAVLLRNFVRTVSVPWVKFFINSDPALWLQKINAKVLALNGDKDLQVLAEPNLKGIIVALQKSKSPVHDVNVLHGLNHLFQECNKCTIAEYGELEQTISPKALQVMGDWLDKNVKK